MEIIKEILLVLIPSSIVFLTSYYIIQTFFKNEEKKNSILLNIKNKENTLPLQLQAYERLTLFLERIAFENLLPRINLNNYTAYEYQNLLIQTIRQEFEHNLSQQLYVSNETWELIKNTKENIISTINSSAALVKNDAPAIELSSVIFKNALKIDKSIRQKTIEALKKEAKNLFN